MEGKGGGNEVAVHRWSRGEEKETAERVGMRRRDNRPRVSKEAAETNAKVTPSYVQRSGSSAQFFMNFHSELHRLTSASERLCERSSCARRFSISDFASSQRVHDWPDFSLGREGPAANE